MVSPVPFPSPGTEADAPSLVRTPARSGDALGNDGAIPPQPPGPSQPRGPRTRTPLRLVLALLPGLALLALWQGLVETRVVPTILLPAPADVARTFWRDFVLDAFSGQSLLPYAGATLTETLAGFALGAAVALPMGYGIARSRWFATMSQPYLAASQALPAVALAPLLAIWLGYGLPPIVALCALIIFFPMVVNTVAGLRALDRDILDAARVDGAGWWPLLRSIEVPLALPTVLAGMRTSLTLSITGAVVGEFVLTDQGLGGLLIIARGNNDAALEFATLLVLAILAAALYGAARACERSVSYLEAR